MAEFLRVNYEWSREWKTYFKDLERLVPNPIFPWSGEGPFS